MAPYLEGWEALGVAGAAVLLVLWLGASKRGERPSGVVRRPPWLAVLLGGSGVFLGVLAYSTGSLGFFGLGCLAIGVLVGAAVFPSSSP